MMARKTTQRKQPRPGRPRKKRRQLPLYHEARDRVAANLMRLRERKGISQVALADAMGASRTRISDIERSVYAISVDGLERIAIALAVDVAELLRPIK